MTVAPAPIEQPVTTPPAEAPKTDSVAEQTIPYGRFKEVNDQLAELRRKDTEREDKARQEIEKQAKDQGKYRELVDQKDAELTTLKPQVATLQEQLTAYQSEIESQLTTRIKALPASLQKLIPEGDALARYKAVTNLEAAAQELRIAASPGTPPGPNGSGATRTSSMTGIEDLKNEKRARIGGL